MAHFSALSALPPDGLLSLIVEYRNDPSPNKIDLGVGVYQNEQGKTPIFEAIAGAHARLSDIEDSKTYVGPMGWPGFADEVKKLILGDELYASLGDRCVVVPTPGGTGEKLV